MGASNVDKLKVRVDELYFYKKEISDEQLSEVLKILGGNFSSKSNEERSIKDTINDKLEKVKRNKKMYGGKKITPVTNFKEFIKEIHNIDHLTNEEFVRYKATYNFNEKKENTDVPWFNYINNNMILQ